MVSFIKNQYLNLPEVYGLVIKVIKQTAGAGNDDFRAFSDFLDLAWLADSAIDNNAAQSGFSGHGADIFMNLFSKFPGWGNNKRAHFFAGSGLEALQERKYKGGGLAGACLGKAKDIAAGENGRHGLALDGGWRSITAGLYAGNYLGVKLKLIKTH